jgi:hypothetical protein
MTIKINYMVKVKEYSMLANLQNYHLRNGIDVLYVKKKYRHKKQKRII